MSRPATMRSRGRQPWTDQYKWKPHLETPIVIGVPVYGSAPTNITVKQNSIVNPVQSISQGPYGLSELSPLWTRCITRGSSLKLEVISNTGASGNMVVGIVPCPSSVPVANYAAYSLATLMELPYSKHIFIPEVMTGRRMIVKNYISTRKLEGLWKSATGDDNYRGTVTADPALLCYWVIYAANINSAAASAAITCIINWKGYTTMFNRTMPAS